MSVFNLTLFQRCVGFLIFVFIYLFFERQEGERVIEREREGERDWKQRIVVSKPWQAGNSNLRGVQPASPALESDSNSLNSI